MENGMEFLYKLSGYLGLLFTFSLYSGDAVDKRSVFLEFQNFYEAIHPAQEKSSDVYAWFSSIPNPFLNVVLHLSSGNVSEKVDALIQNNVQGNPMSFWIHPENHAEGLVDILKERNFTLLVTCPAMTWSVQSVPLSVADIRPADSEVLYSIVSTVYQSDELVKKEYLQILDGLRCENYIFYVDGKPTSTASLFVHGSVGEVFNDATLPESGVASRELMQFLMHRAKELGLERLIVLGYPEAQELYNHLGFETLFHVEIYARAFR
jgi:N-acetylglutamate synthase-like GNAT family acetyltransferase